MPGPIAPGELVILFGSGIGPDAGVPGTVDSTGLYSNLLAGAEVRFDGVPAPIFYAQFGQINAQAPYTIAGQASTHVEVRYQGAIVGAADVPVADVSPGVFPAILNQDGTLNSASNPAVSGSIVTVFACGAGVSQGGGDVAGRIAQPPFGQPRQAVSMMVAGSNATVLYAGAAPGQAGLLQVNLQLPGGLVTGAATVQLSVGITPAPTTTVWIQ
jgi:uncharacterized protein (TIGR03437 family)